MSSSPSASPRTVVRGPTAQGVQTYKHDRHSRSRGKRTYGNAATDKQGPQMGQRAWRHGLSGVMVVVVARAYSACQSTGTPTCASLLNVSAGVNTLKEKRATVLQPALSRMPCRGGVRASMAGKHVVPPIASTVRSWVGYRPCVPVLLQLSPSRPRPGWGLPMSPAAGEAREKWRRQSRPCHALQRALYPQRAKN